MTSDTDRTPPASVEAEQSVLGAMMLSPDACADMAEYLDADDFYNRQHRLIFTAITDLNRAGKPIDAVTIGEHMEANGTADDIGGSGYLINLSSNTPSAANARAYADIIRAKANARALIEAGTDIVNAGFTEAPDEAVQGAFCKIASLQARADITALPPVDLFDDSAAPPIRPEWLPPHLCDFIFESSKVKGCPPEVLAIASLIACSTACHDEFKVQPKANEPGWKESARLWGMVIGDPSVKKTPAIRLAMAPLSDLNFSMVQDYLKQRMEYDLQTAQHKANEKRRIQAEAKGEGAPEKSEAPEAPRQERIIINDATIEKLSDLLSHNPRGMLYLNDEMAGWFASMDQYSKGASAGRDRSYWLKFYDGGRLIIDRMSRPSTVIDNGSMRILGAIQPDRIRSMAERMDDDGLLQRFIIAVIPPGRIPASDEPEPAHLHHKYKTILNHLWNTNPGDGSSIVAMSPEALAVQADLVRFSDALVGTGSLPNMLRSHLAKWQGLFPRLCLTYHMIGCAALKKYPTSLPINESTAKRVAGLMRGFILPHAFAFYSGLASASSPAFNVARKVADFILARGFSRITKRDLNRFVSSWRTLPDWQQANVISLLRQSGWVLDDGKADDRRAPVWTVNPRVHVEFAGRAAQAAAARDAANKAMLELKGILEPTD